MLPALPLIQPIALNISFLEIEHGNIAYLAFLDYLNYLTISDPSLTDLRPLQRCPKLVSLELRAMSTFHLRDLRECPALQQLDFNFPDAAEPQQLALLGQLTNLQLAGVSSFEPVRRVMPPGCQLHRFGMWNAVDVVDLEWMHSDPRLSKLGFLLLGQCHQLRSISGIEAWAETLSGIYLQAPKLFDYQPLGELDNLDFINLAFTPVPDLSFIRGLQKVHTLHLGAAGIPLPNLEPLLELPQLNRLYLHGPESVDLTPLRGKENLEVHILRGGSAVGSKLLGSSSKVIRNLNW